MVGSAINNMRRGRMIAGRGNINCDCKDWERRVVECH
jgi:hypothetical protein